jgi:hypothetical protein
MLSSQIRGYSHRLTALCTFIVLGSGILGAPLSPADEVPIKYGPYRDFTKDVKGNQEEYKLIFRPFWIIRSELAERAAYCK